MSVDTCPFRAGQYTITAQTGPVGAGTCGDRIVVKDQSTFFIMQNYYGPGNCTYSIYADYHNVTEDGAGNLIFAQNTGGNPDEWVITPVGDNKYTIAKKVVGIAWTDPGGPLSCEHQLHLTVNNGTDQQKFTIVRVGD